LELLSCVQIDRYDCLNKVGATGLFCGVPGIETVLTAGATNCCCGHVIRHVKTPHGLDWRKYWNKLELIYNRNLTVHVEYHFQGLKQHSLTPQLYLSERSLRLSNQQSEWKMQITAKDKNWLACQ
jgi:hypothetical protein